MDRDRNEWLAPLTGVAFVALALIGFAVAGEPPDLEDDGLREVVEHYVEDDGEVIARAAIHAVAATLLVFFFGYFRKVLRAAEGEGHVLSLVAFGGALIYATGIAIDSTISFALAETAEDISPQSVEALSALWENDFVPFAVGSQVMLLAAGLSIVRHGALPAWLGWIAIVLALIAVTPIGFAAFIGGAAWILVVAVMLALRARGPAPPPAAASAPAPPPPAA